MAKPAKKMPRHMDEAADKALVKKAISDYAKKDEKKDKAMIKQAIKKGGKK